MMKPRHFLTLNDCSVDELHYLFKRAAWIKACLKRGEPCHTLSDKTLAMIFEKSSTRTRVSFEVGMLQLGGNVLMLSAGDTQIARGEPVKDTSRVISSMADIVMIRTYAQAMVEEFAGYSRVPVINGLTDEYHPCQVLADVFTYQEHRGPITGKAVAWIGDANNMLYSWINASAMLNFKMHVSTPPGYVIDDSRLTDAERAHLETFADPLDAARGASLITTDVWASMGMEAENEKRMRDFKGWHVDGEVMSLGAPDAVFMHCLPAHRGEEVSADVIDGPQSLVWVEAENRMHAQKALLEFLLLGQLKTD